MLKRTLSLFLAFSMVFSLLPLNALAEEAATEDAPVAETTAAVETTQAPEPVTEPAAVPETKAPTQPETEPTAIPETTAETVPETTAVTVPETIPETVPETTEIPNLAASIDIENNGFDGIWTLDEEKDLTLTPRENNDPCYTFSFTAPDTAQYIIWWNEEEIRGFDPFVEITDTTDDSRSGGNAYAVFDGVQDRAYTITIQACSDQSYDAKFTLNKCANLQSIQFWDSELEGYVGQSFWNRLSRTPANAHHGKITWKSNDETVAVVTNPQGTACEVTLVGEGTTTITATTSGGISTSYTITAKATDPWNLNEMKTLSLTQTEQVFSFTAPESKEYIVCWDNITGNGDMLYCVWGEILHGSDHYGNGNVHARFDATAGETYTIKLWADMDVTADVYLKEVEPLTSLSFLEVGPFEVFVGENLWLNLRFEPLNTSLTNLQWEIGDTSVIDFAKDSPYYSGCMLDTKSAGSTTITAKTPDGSIFASCDITVRGMAGELKLDETVNFTATEGESKAYTFTVPEDGDYIIWDKNNNYHGVEVLELNGEHLGWESNALQFTAKKGVQYKVVFHCYGWEETFTYAYTLSKPAEPESISLTETSHFGFVGEKRYLDMRFTPGNADRTGITWSISDPTVLEILREGPSSCEFRMLQEGDATITAKLGDLEASCEVEVKAVEGDFAENNTTEITLNPGESKAFRFTPSDSVNYTVWEVNDAQDYNIEVCDGNGEEVDNRESFLFFDADCDQTYLLKFSNFSDETRTFQFRVDKSVAATGISLPETKDLVVGVFNWLPLTLEPMQALRENIVWTFEPADSVRVVDSGDDFIYFQLLEEGEVTLKAQSMSHLEYTASCKLNAVKAPEIPSNWRQELHYEVGDDLIYSFIPEESGYYTLWADSEGRINAAIMDTETGFTQYGNPVHYECEAGRLYLVGMENVSDEPVDFVAYMKKTVGVEQLRMCANDYDFSASYTGVVGEHQSLSCIPVPFNSMTDEIIWTSSNPDVVEIQWSEDGNCDVVLKRAGAATIRASANGLSCSRLITVKASQTMVEGADYSVTIPANGVAGFLFQAPEDGIYAFYSDNGFRMEVFTADGDWITDGNTSVCFHAEKDNTYLIRCINFDESSIRANFWIGKAVNPEGIKILHEGEDDLSSTVFVGEDVYLEMDVSPLDANYLQAQWMLSGDTDAVKISSESNRSLHLRILSEGTVTVTATLGDLSVSRELNICGATTVTEGFAENVELNPKDRLCYSFTAPEDGTYIFRDDNYSWTLMQLYRVQERENEWVAGECNFVQFMASKGETYLITVRADDEEQRTGNFRLEKCTDVESLQLTETKFLGIVGEVLWIDALFAPENADRSDLVWQVDNPNVIRIRNSYSARAEVLLVGEGTATVTARAGGLTASCTVTSKPTNVIALGDVKTVTLKPEDVAGFLFTPEESGTYVLWDENQNRVWHSLMDIDSNWLGGNAGSRIVFDAEAGKTYMISLVNGIAATGASLKLHMDKAGVQPESIELGREEVLYLYTDTTNQIDVRMTPGNAVHGSLLWESSDSTVVEVLEDEDPYDDFCNFRNLKPGEAVLTVTDTSSGMTDSVKIVVEPIGTMELYKTVEATQRRALDSSILTFVPEETGTYTLRAATDKAVYVWVYVEGGNLTADGRLDSANPEITMELQEGQTYYIETILLSGTSTVAGNYKLCLIPGDAAASEPISFTKDHLILKQGTTAQLPLSYANEAIQELTQVKVDNEDIVTVADGVITAKAVGTTYITATVTLGTTYTVRCRVDVTSNSGITGVQLSTTALTTKLFSEDYASFDVILVQEAPSTSVFARFDGETAVAVDGDAVIGNPRFKVEAMNDLFTLEMKSDRTLLVVPTGEAIDDPAALAKSYTSAILVDVCGETMETAALKLTVDKNLPKLTTTTLTFNSFYTEQSKPVVITGANVEGIEKVSLPAWLTLEDNDLVLTADAPTKSTSGKANLKVWVEGWNAPVPVSVPVKLTYKVPGLKLSASSVTFANAFDSSMGLYLKLVCSNKKETLDMLGVIDLEAPKGLSVAYFNASNGDIVLMPEENCTAGKTQLAVSIDGTENVVKVPLTVYVKPVTLTAKPTSVTLNSVLGDSAVIPLTASPADYAIYSLADLDYTVTDSRKRDAMDQLEIDFDSELGALRIYTNGNTVHGATYKVSVCAAGGKAVAITVKTLAESKSVISVSASVSGSVDLTFPEACATVKPTFKNCAAGGTLEDYTVLLGEEDVSESFDLDFETLRLTANANNAPELGKYQLNLTFRVTEDITKNCSTTFKVVRTPVKLKLSRTSVTLNASFTDLAAVDVTNLTKGYDFTEPVWTEVDGLDVEFRNGMLLVSTILGTTQPGKYTIQVKARPTDSAVKLTVTVAKDSTVSATLKAKGSIDVVRDGTAVSITPVYKNYGGEAYIGENAFIEYSMNGKTYAPVTDDLFEIDRDENGIYTVTKTPGKDVNTAYKYRFVLSFPDAPRSKNAYVNLTVKSGSAKVMLGGTPVLYRNDPYHTGDFRIALTDETLNGIARVEIKDAKLRDLYEILDLGGGEYAIVFRNNTVKSGVKSCSVALNIFMDGNATSKPNAAVTLKLQIR